MANCHENGGVGGVRLSVVAALAFVGLLVLLSGPALVAEAQTSWSRVALGSEGHDVVLDEPRGVLYVSLPEARKITVVDVASGTIVRDIVLVHMPAGMDLSPDGGHLYVALNGASSVAIIDLTDDSIQVISVGVELQTTNVWDVHALDDTRFLVSGDRDTAYGLAGIVLVDQISATQTRVASGRTIADRPAFTANAGDDFVYIGEGFPGNRLYKLDLTQAALPVVAESSYGSDRVKISPDGSLLFVSGVIVRTLDLEFSGNTAAGGFPAPLSDGMVAFVAETGDTVRVIDADNQVVLTRSTACQSSAGRRRNYFSGRRREHIGRRVGAVLRSRRFSVRGIPRTSALCAHSCCLYPRQPQPCDHLLQRPDTGGRPHGHHRRAV